MKMPLVCTECEKLYGNYKNHFINTRICIFQSEFLGELLHISQKEFGVSDPKIFTFSQNCSSK